MDKESHPCKKLRMEVYLHPTQNNLCNYLSMSFSMLFSVIEGPLVCLSNNFLMSVPIISQNCICHFVTWILVLCYSVRNQWGKNPVNVTWWKKYFFIKVGKLSILPGADGKKLCDIKTASVLELPCMNNVCILTILNFCKALGLFWISLVSKVPVDAPVFSFARASAKNEING